MTAHAPQPVEPMPADEARRRLADIARHQTSRIRTLSKKAAKARRYELHECLISSDWEDPGSLVEIVVSRKMPDKTLAIALFLVDLGCMGVKNAMFKASVSRDRYEEMVAGIIDVSEAGLDHCTPELAARVIDHAVRYALALGLKPHRDYFPAIRMLEGYDPDASD